MDLPDSVKWLYQNGATAVTKLRCAECSQKIDCSDAQPFTFFTCPACGTELVVPVELGDYMLCQPLHTSSRAALFLAQDCTLERNVALKIPLHHEDMEYYHQSFSTIANYAHPGILWVYKFNCINQICCGALQFMDMGNCRNATELRRRFGFSRVLEKMIPPAQALKKLEAAGKTHRDICPANFLCSSTGEIRLTNLHPGAEDEWENSPRHWRYQAPESLCNMEFSCAADIYSFCISVYEILCSIYPFKGINSPDDLLDNISRQSPVLLSKINPQIPSGLAETLNAGMDHSPANRPTASEIVKSMQEAMAYIIKEEIL